MEPYIILDGVSKSFRSVEVLKPLSIEFEEGLIHGIVGRNGSGKTVMMKLILGFLKPTQGTVTVGKKRVGKDVDFPQDVGAIIENVDFIPYLNAYDNLYNLAAIRHRITKEDVKQVLETVGLGDTGRKKGGEVFTWNEAEACNRTGYYGKAKVNYFGRADEWTG